MANDTKPTMKAQDQGSGGNDQVSELVALVNDLKSQVAAQAKQISELSSRSGTPAPMQYQPVVINSDSERRRAEVKAAQAKSLQAMENAALPERELADGDVQYFVTLKGEPQMCRIVGVPNIGTEKQQHAIAEQKYKAYFGITAITEHWKVFSFTRYHGEEELLQQVPSRVRQALRPKEVAAAA